MLQEVLSKKEQIAEIAQKYGVTGISVFGSVTRSEAKPDSDIDFLIDLEADRSLFDLIYVKDDLECLFGRNIDVATANSLHPLMREQIMAETIEIWRLEK